MSQRFVCETTGLTDDWRFGPADYFFGPIPLDLRKPVDHTSQGVRQIPCRQVYQKASKRPGNEPTRLYVDIVDPRRQLWNLEGIDRRITLSGTRCTPCQSIVRVSLSIPTPDSFLAEHRSTRYSCVNSRMYAHVETNICSIRRTRESDCTTPHSSV